MNTKLTIQDVNEKLRLFREKENKKVLEALDYIRSYGFGSVTIHFQKGSIVNLKRETIELMQPFEQAIKQKK